MDAHRHSWTCLERQEALSYRIWCFNYGGVGSEELILDISFDSKLHESLHMNERAWKEKCMKDTLWDFPSS